jgi:hypothetical protein
LFLKIEPKAFPILVGLLLLIIGVKLEFIFDKIETKSVYLLLLQLKRMSEVIEFSYLEPGKRLKIVDVAY